MQAKSKLKSSNTTSIISSSSLSNDKKDIITLLIEDSDPIYSSKEDLILTFIGTKASGKSTLINSFINKDKDIEPSNTTGLDYQIARIITNEIPTVCHIWEIGGGRSLIKLIENSIKPETIQNSLCVISLDLSKPYILLDELLFWINNIKKQVDLCLKKKPQYVSQLLDQARFKFKAANGGEHKDIDRVDLFPIPAFIIVNKFDTFKDNDRELLKVMARSLRYIAHTNGMSLLYTSKSTLTPFRIRFKNFLMQTPWPKQNSEISDFKEQNFQAGSDSLEKIGVPSNVNPNASNAQILKGWLSLTQSLFVNVKKELDDHFVLDKDPFIDNIIAQKNEELLKLQKDSAFQQRMDSIDNNKK